MENAFSAGINSRRWDGIGVCILIAKWQSLSFKKRSKPFFSPTEETVIRFHAIPNVDLDGTGMDHIIAFRDYLTQHGVFATIRASRGEDIFAACGMLSTAKQQEEKKKK